ncbi:hypothetical protein FQA47_015820 [Oryzias melastigma]|uniref:Uncharacterized protein n=1 Tax=Oryzias melastigma TaxID=30732 RepID=A0A834CPU9_ORYME|nr:hypothetical protein FQA47_015820 [Oryzias melastigma]
MGLASAFTKYGPSGALIPTWRGCASEARRDARRTFSAWRIETKHLRDYKSNCWLHRRVCGNHHRFI